MFNKISYLLIAIFCTTSVVIGANSYIRVNKIAADIIDAPNEANSQTGLIDHNNGQEASASSKGLLNSIDWNTFNNKVNLSDLSSNVTGLLYSDITGAFSLSSGYIIPTSIDKAKWDQTSNNNHTALTIGTGNGLSLSAQQLSLGLASDGINGALSGTDWNTFNGKQSALVIGDLTAASNKITIGGTGVGAVVGTGLSIDVVESGLSHNNFGGLTSGDPHTQYALLAGRSGGQTISGGTGANDDLTIQGTTNGTRDTSYLVMQPNGGNVGIGTNTPTYNLDVTGDFRVTASATLGTLSVGSVQLIHNGVVTYYRQAADDDTARGTALASAFSASSVGDTLIIGPGNYSISTTLNVLANQNIVLQGANITSIASGFNTFTATAVSGWSISGRGVLTGYGPATESSSVEEAGVYVTSTNPAVHGDWRIEGITITNFKGAGISVSGYTDGSAKHISGIINKCYIKANNYGIYLNENVEYVTISENQILSNNNYGVSFEGGNIFIDGNEIATNKNGIYVGNNSTNHAHGIISNNRITHNTTNGIYVDAITKGENITGNEILAQPCGVYLHSTTGVNIVGGAIYRGSGALPSEYAIYADGYPGGYNYVSGVYFGANTTQGVTSGTTLALRYLIFNRGSFTADAKDYNYESEQVSATNGLSESIIYTGITDNIGLVIKGTTGGATPQLLPNDSSLSGNLQLWFKADSISANDGDQIATWSDSSGNGKDASQSTESKRPTYKTNVLNGKPVVRFNTTSDTSLVTGAVTLTQPYSVFMVGINNGNVLATPLSLEKTSGATGALIYTSGTSTTANLYAGASLTYTVNPAVWNIYDAVFNNTTSKIAINGGTDTTGSAGANNITSNVTIGRHRLSYTSNGYGWDGDISEVIIFSGELSKAQREGITRYLSKKYAIGITAGTNGGSPTQSANLQEWQDSAGTTLASIGSTGTGVFDKIGIGTTSPTAYLHLKAGTATASTAPLKLTTGTLLATEESGAIEFVTDTFYMTATNGVAGSTKRQAIPGVTTGTDVPATTPIRVGDIYVDTTNHKVYVSDGTTNSSNWVVLN